MDKQIRKQSPILSEEGEGGGQKSLLELNGLFLINLDVYYRSSYSTIFCQTIKATDVKEIIQGMLLSELYGCVLDIDSLNTNK